MNKGVRADKAYSHRKLELRAEYVRTQLRFGPREAIDPLRLFEDLGDITIATAGGEIPLYSRNQLGQFRRLHPLRR